MKRTTMPKNVSPTALFVRAQTFRAGKPGSQRGASALEYIVLAAAIIGIVTLLITQTDVGTTFTGAFEGLFDDAANPGA
ncbi:hypothetical protein EZI54_16515 [Marinobacter halodurans]|uniref:Flp family type IVb pilin n=1 Tax=Marinobacter halodurans TaxID=2528979 RepID=A0ABY1ZIQ4_9GAMM|nr:hypothetical protein [Marinobacter halodurans]TBW51843.1 hypothetical protein EZI54_16515 [Marinobacter halodurans]